MRSRSGWTLAAVVTVSLLSADTAAAQQTFNFSLGYFGVRGEDARIDGDALVVNRDLYLFDFSDFNSFALGAEWLAPLGDFVEVGAGIGFTNRSVDTIYDDLVRPDGSEIEQALKLRIVPITGSIRLLPLGRNNAFQPYIGGGIGLYNWRYSETGEFVDLRPGFGQEIFRDSYVASGTSVGPVAVFGARFLAGSNMIIGGEVRYQKAEGDLDENDFLGPKIDLGGFHYVATFGFRF
jgi:opacity protein-like surface antigen